MNTTTEYVTSTDGTRIAYERVGSGTLLIAVDGAFQFRAFDPTTGQLAQELAERGYSVLRYDRRGRGESAATDGYGLTFELDDLRALIAANGGEAALFGR